MKEEIKTFDEVIKETEENRKKAMEESRKKEIKKKLEKHRFYDLVHFLGSGESSLADEIFDEIDKNYSKIRCSDKEPPSCSIGAAIDMVTVGMTEHETAVYLATLVDLSFYRLDILRNYGNPQFEGDESYYEKILFTASGNLRSGLCRSEFRDNPYKWVFYRSSFRTGKGVFQIDDKGEFREREKILMEIQSDPYYWKDIDDFKRKKEKEIDKWKRCYFAKKRSTGKYYKKNKAQVRLKAKEYREKNLDKIHARERKRRANMTDDEKAKLNASRRDYYKKNKERLRDYSKTYYEKHNERIKLKSKNYYKLNKDRIKAKVSAYHAKKKEEK